MLNPYKNCDDALTSHGISYDAHLLSILVGIATFGSISPVVVF